MIGNEILLDFINDFKPAKVNPLFRELSRGILRPVEKKLPKYNSAPFSKGHWHGDMKLTDENELIVCSFKFEKELSERSGKKEQYNLAKKILKDFPLYTGGFFIFYDAKGDFRLSLIYDIPGPDGKRYGSNFRRYTYFVTKEQTNKTFRTRLSEADFSSFESIIDAFSVEKVTKEFYEAIANWYFWALRNATYSKDAESEKDGKEMSTIRLITRLIFIWFMKIRKLIPDELFNEETIKNYLQEYKPGGDNYYKAILQNLFFATLNTKQSERRFRSKKRGYNGFNTDFGNHNVYRYEKLFKNSDEFIEKFFLPIPFLNGGLFECLDYKGKIKEDRKYIDGFTDLKEYQPNVPNYLFYSNEKLIDLEKEYGQTKYKKTKVQGIINTLSTYNFTINENDPNDAEVALDPELLGKVFENLLAVYNPETAQTARKSTGSYYTPRPIVDYMVEESLKQYFKTHLSENGIEEKLNELFSKEKLDNPFDSSLTIKIVGLIDSLRIVDPAVGSGAFPMGVLNKLVFILHKLDPDNSLWKNSQIEGIRISVKDPLLQRQLITQVKKRFHEKNADYGRKLYLIEKCIYGVDIQPIAIEIAKLRFFISLLVDEKIDFNKIENNYGIEALPNLDFKLMQGDSLISSFYGIDFRFKDDDEGNLFDSDKRYNQLIKEFEELKALHQNEPDKKLKDDFKEQIEQKLIEIFRNKIENCYPGLKNIENKYSDVYDEKKKSEYIDTEKKQFFQKIKFDVEKAEKDLIAYTEGRDKKNFFLWNVYFAEVFAEKNGFDIVIGNPPYIQLQKTFDKNNKFADLYKNQSYKTFDRTGDIYCLFYEKGINLLCNDGHLAFITSNKWMRAGYGEKLRKFFSNYNPEILIDLGPGVFESATVDTSILIIQKSKNRKRLHAVTINEKKKDNIDFSSLLEKNGVILKNLTSDTWFIGSNAEQQLKEKIERIGKPLKDWDVNIYRGILTGLNEAFIIDNEKRKEILDNCKDEAERKRTEAIIKPILRGRDIKRYYYEWAGLWVIVIPAGWTNENRGNENPEMFIEKTFPSLMNHLSKFKEKAQKRDDQGDYWWELRACAYYSEFEKEKVVYSEIVRQPQFYYDRSNFFIEATSFLMTGKFIKYICALLNSNPVTFFFKRYYAGGGLGEEGFRYKKAFLENLPMPPITSATEPIVHQIELLVDKILAAKKENPQADTSNLEKEIDRLVYKLYDLTEEEIRIVENKK